MSTANIYGFPNSKAHAPRNAFDMSFDTLFNSPAGMILPGFVDDVKAGDKYKLSCKNFTRTSHVNTAAFMSFDQKMDFWFVPYRLIWSAYNQWRLGNTQPRSTTALMDVSRLDVLPHAKWSDFYIQPSTGDPTLALDSFDGKYTYNVGYFSAMCRFLDLLGYGLLPVTDVTKKNSVKDLSTSDKGAIVSFFQLLNKNYNFNFFRLAAYQCVYMHGYRNEDFEALDPSYYNIDSAFLSAKSYAQGKLDVDGSTNSAYDANVTNPYHLYHGYSMSGNLGTLNVNRLTLKKLFTPRYKNLRKDLFTSVKPSSGITMNWSATGNFPSTDVVIEPTNGNTQSDPDGKRPYEPSIASGIVSAQDVRNLMALDKFTRLAIYADKNYSSLYEAIFGVKVDEPDVPRYLGSFSSRIDISEVVATAAGNDGDSANPASSVLGELAGKGTGGEKSFVFDADFKEDGVIIGMHYIMPYNYYNPYRLDYFNLKSSRYDYYYPSFDGLGLSPVYQGEFGYWFRDRGGVSNTYFSSILGYNTRYHEYKQRSNTVHGTFAPNQQDEYWTLTLNDDYVANPEFLFKVNPTCTDAIFGVNWNGAPSTDPFKCFFSFNAIKVSNMEAVGVPNT